MAGARTISKRGAHLAAQRAFPAPLGPCERGCGREAKQRHHKNKDVYDNSRENIELLCVHCHMAHHKGMREPVKCSICDRMCGPKDRRRGRCDACRRWFERHGFERPAELWRAAA